MVDTSVLIDHLRGNDRGPIMSGTNASGCSERLDLLKRAGKSVALDLHVVAALKVQPESLGGPEIPGEPQRRVGADASLAVARFR